MQMHMIYLKQIVEMLRPKLKFCNRWLHFCSGALGLTPGLMDEIRISGMFCI